MSFTLLTPQNSSAEVLIQVQLWVNRLDKGGGSKAFEVSPLLLGAPVWVECGCAEWL